MPDPNRAIALVGRPNVGKSRLFNRLAGRRLAIVHDQPGVTRDVQAVEVDRDFMLLDTGGIGLVPDPRQPQLVQAVEEQVFFAVRSAAVICLVVDGREGLTPLDEIVLERLRREGKEPILVVNKIDTTALEGRVAEFDALGLRHAVAVSAEHGHGIEELQTLLTQALGPVPAEPPPPPSRRIRLCFAGRPNVGKSSLCNALLQAERMVVSEVPGTTRDAVEIDLDYRPPEGEPWPFRLIDTAGMRRFTRVDTAVEYFSLKRSQEAIERADVVFLVLDAREGVTGQDQTVAGQIQEAGKAHAILVNKWDLARDTFAGDGLHGYKNENEFRHSFAKAVTKELFFLPQTSVLFASAKTGFALDKLLIEARRLDAAADRNLPTAKVNTLLHELMARREPRYIKGRRLKIYYATQVHRRPCRIRLFCNQAAKLDETYRRYLESGFIREFELAGCPIRFDVVGKPPRQPRT